MSSTLLENATGLLTPELVTRLGSQLGETDGSVSRGLAKGAIPLLLAGLVTKGQDAGGAEKILGLLRDPAYDSRVPQSAGSLLGEAGPSSGMRQLGERLLSLLFGGRLESLSAALAEFAGIRPASASSLLRLAAPALLGVLGNRVKRDGLDASSLGRLFSNERDDILDALPSPLRQASGLSIPRAADVVPPLRSGAPRWIWLGLAALAIAFLWSTFVRDREAPARVATARPVAELPPVGAPRPSIVWVTQHLPDGTDLRIPENGIEIHLVGLLEGNRSRDEWVDFDRLLFETNSATLKPESQDQLKEVAAILAAYPSAQIKIGGYTDNTGDPTSNLKLSQDRATNVRNSLVDLGVGADRLEAEGYGEQHPIASNATDDGRAKNRRIALHVEKP